jgi:hypothetical protein
VIILFTNGLSSAELNEPSRLHNPDASLGLMG